MENTKSMQMLLIPYDIKLLSETAIGNSYIWI